MKSKTPNLLCFGEVLFDLIAGSHCTGWPLSRVLESPSNWIPFPGGAPANVATGFKKLGGQSSFCGAIGNDAPGRELRSLFDMLGVGSDQIMQLDQYPTRQVLVTRTESGDREFSGFIDGLSSTSFADCYYDLGTEETAGTLGNKIRQNEYSAVVMGTLGLVHGPTATSMKSLAKWTREDSKTLLTIDVNWRNAFWQSSVTETVARQKIVEFLSTVGADIIKLTDEEAKFLFGVDPSLALNDPEKVYQKLGVKKGVLVTAGEKGASFYFEGVGAGYQPAYQVDVVETTGAGDAFTAGFLRSLLSTPTDAAWTLDDARRALDMASAAGGLTCTKPGAIAAQPTLDEVHALMKASGPFTAK